MRKASASPLSEGESLPAHRGGPINFLPEQSHYTKGHVIIVKWFTLSQSKSVFSDPRDGAGYRPRRYRSLNTILIVPVENSNSAILMMQSAKNRVGRSAAVELNCTPEWRIFVQRQVR